MRSGATTWYGARERRRGREGELFECKNVTRRVQTARFLNQCFRKRKREMSFLSIVEIDKKESNLPLKLALPKQNIAFTAFGKKKNWDTNELESCELWANDQSSQRCSELILFCFRMKLVHLFFFLGFLRELIIITWHGFWLYSFN